MIVFTITNNESDRVFVASCRNAPEDRWEQLITQANEGSEGEIFDEIRNHDTDVFSVEEWGFGEDPKEIRQLMREAQHDLAATVVNTGKVDALPSAKRKKLTDREASKLLEDIEKSLANDSADDLIPTPSMDSDDDAETDDEDEMFSSESSPKDDNPNALPSVKSQAHPEPIKPVTVDRTESLIEQLARKVERENVAASAKKLAIKKASAAPKPSASNNTPVDKLAKEKLPTGRTSSRVKEQQIRERIDKEREDRAQAKQAAERREAVQMSKVIASIELRRKTQKPAKPKAKPTAKAGTLTKASKTEQAAKATLTRTTAKETATTAATKATIADPEQLTQALIKTGFIEQNEPVEKKPIEPLFDRAMAIKSARALNEVIRAKRAQQYAPKAPEESKKRESISSVQDKRLQRMIEKEKAMLEAKKQAMSTSSAGEMAEIVARIDSRNQESTRTLRRR